MSESSPSPLSYLTLSTGNTIPSTLYADSPIFMPSHDHIEKSEAANTTSPFSVPHMASSVSEQTTSPFTQNNDLTSNTRRKLSFGMPDFGNGTRLKMPPPPRRLPPSADDELFLQFINPDSYLRSESEITFKDIGYSRAERYQETPKTPVLLETGSPSSPIAIRDNTEYQYPRCCDGRFADIPLFHLEALRKTVDPAFQNHQYWGDGLYFSDQAVHSHYCDRTPSELAKRDWSTVFHALDNDADHRIPLPDTTTHSYFTLKQLRNILWDWSSPYSQEFMKEEINRKQWTLGQMYLAGLKWSEVRGNYYADPPEFTTRPNQDMCASPEFKAFCSSASFCDGGSAVEPGLDHTSSVLRRARQRPLIIPDEHEVDRQQIVQTSQDPVPAAPATQPDDTTTVEPQSLSNFSTIPVVASPADPPQQPPRPPQQTSQNVPLFGVSPFMRAAYHDPRVFLSLPRELLLGLRQGYLHDRDQYAERHGQSAPNTDPSREALWEFFRHELRRRSAAAAARASVANGLLPTQQGTPVSSRPVQLQPHMPTTPRTVEATRTDTPRSMDHAATPLGSPFMTPGRLRNTNIDPRLA